MSRTSEYLDLKARIINDIYEIIIKNDFLDKDKGQYISKAIFFETPLPKKQMLLRFTDLYRGLRPNPKIPSWINPPLRTLEIVRLIVKDLFYYRKF